MYCRHSLNVFPKRMFPFLPLFPGFRRVARSSTFVVSCCVKRMRLSFFSSRQPPHHQTILHENANALYIFLVHFPCPLSLFFCVSCIRSQKRPGKFVFPGGTPNTERYRKGFVSDREGERRNEKGTKGCHAGLKISLIPSILYLSQKKRDKIENINTKRHKGGRKRQIGRGRNFIYFILQSSRFFFLGRSVFVCPAFRGQS